MSFLRIFFLCFIFCNFSFTPVENTTETISSGYWNDFRIWSNGVPRKNSNIIINHRTKLDYGLKSYSGRIIINDTLEIMYPLITEGKVFINYSGTILNEIRCKK